MSKQKNKNEKKKEETIEMNKTDLRDGVLARALCAGLLRARESALPGRRLQRLGAHEDLHREVTGEEEQARDAFRGRRR